MGGGVTNLTAVKLGLATYDPDTVHGTFLDLAEIDRQVELYRTRVHASSRTSRRRSCESSGAGSSAFSRAAEVILAAACVVRTILARVAQESLMVSDRGLRHGLLIGRFGRAAA
jgi:exopolyphosphatase / guanosine-5'-triphosphate,3'-diphosphate pyrophosphatase